MFLVGGGILTHGIPGASSLIEQLSLGAGATLQPLIALTLDGVAGLVAGAVVLACVSGIKKLR